MTYRHFDQHIKSLIHFDYPYYGEANDGLNDEINGTIWERSGNARLVGAEAPAAQIIPGTPKFGYRCLHTSADTDFIALKEDTSLFALTESGTYEFSCYVRAVSSTAGNIISLYSGDTALFSITLTNDLKVSVSCPSWDYSKTSTGALSLNVWSWVCVKLSSTELRIVIDTDKDIFTLTDRTALAVTQCHIGGIVGEIDEFVFRDSWSTSIPSAPIQATLRVSELGGFGTGSTGDVVIYSNCVLNTSARLSVTSGSSSTHVYTISGTQTGMFGAFTAGDVDIKFEKVTNIEYKLLEHDKKFDKVFDNSLYVCDRDNSTCPFIIK